jgi:hypothetical protein
MPRLQCRDVLQIAGILSRNVEDVAKAEADLAYYRSAEEKVKALIPKEAAAKEAEEITIPDNQRKVRDLEAQVRSLAKQIESVSRSWRASFIALKMVPNPRSRAKKLSREISRSRWLP